MESVDNQFIKDRPSTRVHMAPGGKSSIIFGDEDKVTIKPVKSGDENSASSSTSTSPKSSEKQNNENAQNNQNSPNNKNARTCIRVRQPPGGASSIIFG